MKCDYCEEKIRWYQRRFSSFWSIKKNVHHKCRINYLEDLVGRLWPLISHENRINIDT